MLDHCKELRTSQNINALPKMYRSVHTFAELHFHTVLCSLCTEREQAALEIGDVAARSSNFLQADTPSGQIMACAWLRVQSNY